MVMKHIARLVNADEGWREAGANYWGQNILLKFLSFSAVPLFGDYTN
jgi:hypothetical protein